MRLSSNRVLLLCAVGLLLSGFGFSGMMEPVPQPEVSITDAKPELFPIPYGYGIRITYFWDLKEKEVPGRRPVSVTTQYSPDMGATWYTDEEQRSPDYFWDNIHGDIECGPTNRNLESGVNYYLRIILNYVENGVALQKTSNVVHATVRDYDHDDFCLEEQIAEKFTPVLHRHPQDKQPPVLANVDNVNWQGTVILRGPSSAKPVMHSRFHWQAKGVWDTWGKGFLFSSGPNSIEFRWDIPNNERYKIEKPGESPLYYHIFKSGEAYIVQYWYFLTMNDIRDQTSLVDPWHEGDFEHVAMRLEKVDGRLVPTKVNFYFHEGGRQYLPEECWWGAENIYETPQLGYADDRTHLHVWIARNAHASYNYKAPIHKVVSIGGATFIDDVDYTLGHDGEEIYEAYFHWDKLINMGEIRASEDTNGDGYPNAHGFEWVEHYEHVPAWTDLQWMPFQGHLGDYWCFDYVVGEYCSKSPPSPTNWFDWDRLSANSDYCGFGNPSRGSSVFGIYTAKIQYLDPDTGAVICTRRLK